MKLCKKCDCYKCIDNTCLNYDCSMCDELDAEIWEPENKPCLKAGD